jgi:hypothetical protein
MIIKWLLDALSFVIGGAMSGVAALVPEPPSWVDSGLGQLSDLFASASDFSVWIPIPLALTLVAWMVAAQGAAMVMKLIRIGVSYATFGGGAVAD